MITESEMILDEVILDIKAHPNWKRDDIVSHIQGIIERLADK